MEFSRTGKIQLKKPVLSKPKFASVIISAFLVLLTIVFLFLLRTVFSLDTIYKGILIDGKDMGGYTKDELSVYLENHYANAFDGLELTLISDRFERNITLSDLEINIDIGSMIKKAHETGRSGSIIQRFFKILSLYSKPESIKLMLDFETEGFDRFLDQTGEAVYQEIVPPNIVILEDRVILGTGLSGQEADRERLKGDIIKAMQELKSAKIIVPVIEKRPPQIDVETTLKALNSEPVDARFVKTSRTTYEIKPHQMGRKISKDQLMGVVNYIENRESKGYEELTLPVEFITPKLTEESLKEQLFRDTLTSYTTRFRTDTENGFNRSINIGLAAESIDGTILSPGEEFSFNKIVGPRTVEKGYKTAHVFVDGEIRDGTGGGVCQVSTTLYNAVLRSNLEVTERHNHMFTVGYVPLGLDAAVSYGYADLVFKNTTGHPLLINTWVTDNNTLTFQFRSTNDYPDVNIKLASKTIRTIPVTDQYIDDPARLQGSEIISDNGSTGYVVDTYMKIFNGDVLLREEKLHRSVYQMIPRKIIRGTASGY